ncbi:MAG: AAA family ATPase [Cyanophyceae cyanobacterium]
MPHLILLIGLPGSGKSSLARQLTVVYPRSQIIATDAIRAQLFGDEAVQGPWQLVWRQVEVQFRSAVESIQAGSIPQAIYDATNVARRQRREAIALARATGFTHLSGLWLDTPLPVCLERNRRRERFVPVTVIERMYRQLRGAPPALDEGLDRLVRYSSRLSSVCI